MTRYHVVSEGTEQVRELPTIHRDDDGSTEIIKGARGFGKDIDKRVKAAVKGLLAQGATEGIEAHSAHCVRGRLAIAHWNAASLFGGLRSVSHRQT